MQYFAENHLKYTTTICGCWNETKYSSNISWFLGTTI